MSQLKLVQPILHFACGYIYFDKQFTQVFDSWLLFVRIILQNIWFLFQT